MRFRSRVANAAGRLARRQARSPPSPRWAPRAGAIGAALANRRSRARSRRWSGWRTPGLKTFGEGGSTRGSQALRTAAAACGTRRRQGLAGIRREAPAPRRARRDARRARGRRGVSREGVRGALGARRARRRALRPLQAGRRRSRPRRPRRPREEPQRDASTGGGTPSEGDRDRDRDRPPDEPATTSARRPRGGARGERAGGCVRRQNGSRSPGRRRRDGDELEHLDDDADDADVDADVDADATMFDRDVAATTRHAARLLHLPVHAPAPRSPRGGNSPRSRFAGTRSSCSPRRWWPAWCLAIDGLARGRPGGARAAAVATGAQVEPVRSTVSGSRGLDEGLSAVYSRPKNQRRFSSTRSWRCRSSRGCRSGTTRPSPARALCDVVNWRLLTHDDPGVRARTCNLPREHVQAQKNFYELHRAARRPRLAHRAVRGRRPDDAQVRVLRHRQRGLSLGRALPRTPGRGAAAGAIARRPWDDKIAANGRRRG